MPQFIFFGSHPVYQYQAGGPKEHGSQSGGLTLMRHPALAKSGYKVKIDYQNANNDQSNLKTMA